MIRDHKFYEMQSALAATGHLTGSELEELEQHVSQCVSCRNCMVDMAIVSRELFLTQVRSHSLEPPRGMQQRFIERAIAAGIPLETKRAFCAAFDLRFARVAAVTAVLALLVSLGWKVTSAPRVEGTSQQFSSHIEAPPEVVSETIPPSYDGSAGHTALASEKRTKRWAAVRGSAGLPHGNYRNLPHPNLALNTPLFAGQAMPSSLFEGSAFWTGTHSVGHTSFTKAFPASLFGRKWGGKPEGRSFHLDLTLAYLARSDSPVNAGATALGPNLKFSAPVFHIDPSRIW